MPSLGGWIFGLALIGVCAAAIFGEVRIQRYRAQKVEILAERRLPTRLDSSASEESSGRSVYLVGDSQAAHWPLNLMPAWHLYRTGFPGEATPNIMAAAAPLLVSVKAQTIIVLAGTNDVSAAALLPAKAREAAVANAVRALSAFAIMAHRQGAGEVLVAMVPPNRRSRSLNWLVWGSALEHTRDLFNRTLVAACTSVCRPIDLSALLEIRTAADWDRYLTDGVHLNDAAYEKLAKAIEGMLSASTPG